MQNTTVYCTTIIVLFLHCTVSLPSYCDHSFIHFSYVCQGFLPEFVCVGFIICMCGFYYMYVWVLLYVSVYRYLKTEALIQLQKSVGRMIIGQRHIAYRHMCVGCHNSEMLYVCKA